MLKLVILTLGAFTLVLWTALFPALFPAQAQVPHGYSDSHSVVYSWGYNRVGSHQKVCKQVESIVKLDPRYPEKPSLKMHTRVVGDRYCTHLP